MFNFICSFQTLFVYKNTLANFIPINYFKINVISSQSFENLSLEIPPLLLTWLKPVCALHKEPWLIKNANFSCLYDLEKIVLFHNNMMSDLLFDYV